MTKRTRQRRRSKTHVPARATGHDIETGDKGEYLPSTRRRRAKKDPEVDYPNMPEYTDNDNADREINRAQKEGRKANVDAAYPDPPKQALAAVEKHMSQSHTKGYQMEYRLKLMHRMLLRNMPMDTIAQTLGVPIETARRMRTTLNKALAQEAKNFNVETHVGSSLAFFNEVRGQAMRLATDTKQTGGARVGALGVALEAQKDTIRFMQAIGAYEANPMQWGNADDTLVEQGTLLQEMAEAFLSGESEGPLTLDADGVPVRESDEDEIPEDVRIIEGL